MANPSIYAAFEKLWLNINAMFSKIGHTHDDKYYTESEVDEKIAESAAAVKSDLLNGAGDAYDTLKELGDLIDENTDALDALEIIATGKADASTVTSHTGNTTVHITADERTSWNSLQGQIDDITESALRKVELTQVEYDALTEKDPSVIYIITDKDDADYIGEDQIGIAGGVASLDSSGKVPSTQLPSTMTPSAHAASHKTNGSDPLTAADIDAAPAGYGYGGQVIDLGMVTEAELETKLTELLGTMQPIEAKQFCANGFVTSDWRWFGTLYKSSANYASCLMHGAYNNGTLIQKTFYAGAWKPMIVGVAPAYTYGTSDMTAGTSALTTGTLYFVYE